jgi:hypothetical protein
MGSRSLGEPRLIEIAARGVDKRRFEFHLFFPAPMRKSPIVFDVSDHLLTDLLRALQNLHRIHNIPIPPTRPPRGRKLVLVEKAE